MGGERDPPRIINEELAPSKKKNMIMWNNKKKVYFQKECKTM